jgi:hypothetical protein
MLQDTINYIIEDWYFTGVNFTFIVFYYYEVMEMINEYNRDIENTDQFLVISIFITLFYSLFSFLWVFILGFYLLARLLGYSRVTKK